MPLCEARCGDSKMHLEECKLLRSSPINGEFDEYDIITPLRALLLKKTDPQAYQAMHALESNMELKVSKLILF